MEIAGKWKEALGLDEKKAVSGMVCVEHFKEEDFIKTKNRLLLKESAIPIARSSPSSQKSQQSKLKSYQNRQNESYTLRLENEQLRESLKRAEHTISNLKQEFVEQKQHSDNIMQSLRTRNVAIKKTLKYLRVKMLRFKKAKSQLATEIKELKKFKLLYEKFADALEVI